MLPRRHAEILRHLDAEGTLGVAELARRLGVSAETVRRDLRSLAEGGAVLRMHGGAGIAGQAGEAPFRRRMRENAPAKQAIAEAFAQTVRSGEVLILDTGTTTSFVARALVRHRRLTVITNSTDAARILCSGGDHRVYLAGGALRPDSGAVLGPSAEAFVRGFAAGVAVISAGAVDGSGVMDFDPDEAALARAALDRADRRVLVSDASKFGRRGLVLVAPLDRLTEVVTDAPPPPPVAGAMAALPLRLTLARAERGKAVA